MKILEPEREAGGRRREGSQKIEAELFIEHLEAPILKIGIFGAVGRALLDNQQVICSNPTVLDLFCIFCAKLQLKLFQ